FGDWRFQCPLLGVTGETWALEGGGPISPIDCVHVGWQGRSADPKLEEGRSTCSTPSWPSMGRHRLAAIWRWRWTQPYVSYWCHHAASVFRRGDRQAIAIGRGDGQRERRCTQVHTARTRAQGAVGRARATHLGPARGRRRGGVWQKSGGRG
ncbi:hypothetical protein BJ912DRAFT_955286, partial [Pholiota molesta]